MSDTTISGSLPKGDANGMGPAVRGLIDYPHRLQVMIAIIDCAKITNKPDTGEIVPTARIRRVEMILRDDLAVAEQLMRRALESRAGRSVLPLELEDDLRMAFEGIDPRTGERTDSDTDE